MFCTKCGKELYAGDRFCAYCGAEVRRTEKPKYDEIIFNPPFKVEAEKKTQEILEAAAPKPEEPKKKQTQPVSFDWDLDGFPAVKPKKTEAVDFNWESVVERRNLSRTQEISVEKIQKAQQELEREAKPEPAAVAEPEPYRMPEETAEATKPVFPEETAEAPKPVFPEETAAPMQEEPLSIEELEREIFGSVEPLHREEPAPTIVPAPAEEPAPTIVPAPAEDPAPKEEKASDPDRERFYTYHQKTDAFEELLNKEKARIQKMEESYQNCAPNVDYTWVPEVFPQKVQKAQPEENAQEAQAAPETQRSPQDQEPPAVAVVQPVTPKTIDLTLSISLPDGEVTVKAEEEENSPSKSKLRYSDIFPRITDDNDSGDGSDSGAEARGNMEKKAAAVMPDLFDEEEEEEKPKKHILVKIVITILILLILAEGFVLGVKFLAPDSKLSMKVNDVLTMVMDRFTGEDRPQAQTGEDGANSEADAAEAYYSEIVNKAAADVQTIGSVQYDAALCYEDGKTYAFDDIAKASALNDTSWKEAQDGSSVTYAQAITEALIRYYDEWQASNPDPSLVGINKLDIGQIRVGEEGFYILCRVTFAGEDAEIVKYQTVYARPSEERMVIHTVKEERL